MEITMASAATGSVNTMTINVTEQQLAHYANSGMCIQDALPHLSADEREFLMTGVTPAEWNEMFGDDE
jgi:hypothetical protein